MFALCMEHLMKMSSFFRILWVCFLWVPGLAVAQQRDIIPRDSTGEVHFAPGQKPPIGSTFTPFMKWGEPTTVSYFNSLLFGTTNSSENISVTFSPQQGNAWSISGIDRSNATSFPNVGTFTHSLIHELPSFSSGNAEGAPAVALDVYVVSGTFEASSRTFFGYGLLIRSVIDSQMAISVPQYSFIIANLSPTLSYASSNSERLVSQLDPAAPTAKDPFPNLTLQDCTPFAGDCVKSCECKYLNDNKSAKRNHIARLLVAVAQFNIDTRNCVLSTILFPICWGFAVYDLDGRVTNSEKQLEADLKANDIALAKCLRDCAAPISTDE